jgi:NAD(P)-dependent dehydrogenase (short-subunit alcohol dehydrogenase family)
MALTPKGRSGRTQQLVGARVYLASDAAKYTTGEVIFCNGGRAWG